MTDVTRILLQIESGDPAAAEQLLGAVRELITAIDIVLNEDC